MSAPIRPLIILQVEDTPADVLLMAHALKDVGHELYVVPNGEQALAFLRKQQGFTHMPRPDLVLLDIDLPGLSGHEVLSFIKKDEALRCIPVIIFSNLDTDESHLLAYNNFANSYVIKPGDLAKFTKLVQTIVSYWSQTRLFAVQSVG